MFSLYLAVVLKQLIIAQSLHNPNESGPGFIDDGVVIVANRLSSSYCYGSAVSVSRVLTACTCLGKYEWVEKKSHMEIMKYSPYPASHLQIQTVAGGKHAVQSFQVHDLCSPNQYHKDIFMHDLGILKVKLKFSSFLSIPPPDWKFNQMCVFYSTAPPNVKFSIGFGTLNYSLGHNLECIETICKSLDPLCNAKLEKSLKGYFGCLPSEDKPHRFGSPLLCGPYMVGVVSKYYGNGFILYSQLFNENREFFTANVPLSERTQP